MYLSIFNEKVIGKNTRFMVGCQYHLNGKLVCYRCRTKVLGICDLWCSNEAE